MYNNLIMSLNKPEIYTKTKVEFWNDAYISKQMLKAHLDPEFEGASRKLAFIDNSVAWIQDIVPSTEHPLLLDLGCGPGIYAEKFTQNGYQVTGIDFSLRSIEYARKSAASKNFNITYLYQNYLEMDLGKRFDFITMIYCDYGALSTKDRQILLSKMYLHLKPGGKLLLDVFSMKKFNEFKEAQTWDVCLQDGFWRADEYVAINGCYKYPGNVTLSLISIISKDGITPYYLWDTYYSKEDLIQEISCAGFKVCGVFGDVAGSSFHEESETIAILLEKE